MSKIYTSASKIVFLLLTVTACLGFLIRILPVEQFMIMAMAAFGYYFRSQSK